MKEMTLEEAIKRAGPAKVRVLAPLLKSLPAIIARSNAALITGGLVSTKTLATHDSEGNGPRVRIKFKQKVVYPVAYFLEYLESRKVKVVVSAEL